MINWTVIKFLKCHSSNDTFQKMKKQAVDCEKYSE